MVCPVIICYFPSNECMLCQMLLSKPAPAEKSELGNVRSISSQSEQSKRKWGGIWILVWEIEFSEMKMEKKKAWVYIQGRNIHCRFRGQQGNCLGDNVNSVWNWIISPGRETFNSTSIILAKWSISLLQQGSVWKDTMVLKSRGPGESWNFHCRGVWPPITIMLWSLRWCLRSLRWSQ